MAEIVDWEAIYKKYLPRVYNFFRYRVNDKLLAEDLTATTFEKAWRGRMRYRRDLSAFPAWLFTIARNVAIDHFRQKHSETSLDRAPQLSDPVSLEETVQRKDDLDCLAALLVQLSAREQELIAFKYGAELTNREIARLAHLSESNVGTILNRAVQKLRAEWEAER
jgi:RNA polymerase sigma factor (sigma-70 family)